MSWEDRVDDVWVTTQCHVGEGPKSLPLDERVTADHVQVTPWKPIGPAADMGGVPIIIWTACFREPPHELELLARSGDLTDQEIIEKLLGEVRQLKREKKDA